MKSRMLSIVLLIITLFSFSLADVNENNVEVTGGSIVVSEHMNQEDIVDNLYIQEVEDQGTKKDLDEDIEVFDNVEEKKDLGEDIVVEEAGINTSKIKEKNDASIGTEKAVIIEEENTEKVDEIDSEKKNQNQIDVNIEEKELIESTNSEEVHMKELKTRKDETNDLDNEVEDKLSLKVDIASTEVEKVSQNTDDNSNIDDVVEESIMPTINKANIEVVKPEYINENMVKDEVRNNSETYASDDIISDEKNNEITVVDKITENIEQGMQGEGTEKKPYVILTRKHLESVRNDLSASYVLGNDIDLQMIEWAPIGDGENPFIGDFNGDGYTIRNVKINQESGNRIGLFGRVNGEIYDLVLENVDIKGSNYVGGLVGELWRYDGHIHDCKIIGNNRVEGKTFVGGFVGFNIGRIESSSSIGNVIGDTQVGGFAGRNNKVITNSYSDSNVEARRNVGGFVGYVTRNEVSPNYIEVQECYSTGKVSGDENVGGMIGFLQGRKELVPEIKDVMSLSVIDSSSTSVGGIVGKSENSGGNAYEENIIANSYYIEKCNKEIMRDYSIIGESTNTDVINGYYIGYSTDGKIGAGIMLEQVYNMEAYKGYDFNSIWTIDSGKSSPYLKNLSIPDGVYDILNDIDTMQGEGTEENPYLILNRDHLERVNDDLSACYRVGKDIDLEMKEWSPIGSRDYPFIGKFDGDGYKIKNMKIDQELGRHLGLFARIDGEVSDLIIENVDIRGEHYIGALAGYVWKENGYVHDCKIIGENRIEGKTTIGGLVGFNIGRIELCSSEGHIIGEYHLGGLVGRNNKIVRRCYSNSTVEGGKYVGGLIGYVTRNEYNPNYIEVQECYSEGKVVGDEFVGGLIGMLQARGEYIPKIKDVMSFCDIDCKSESVGGIVGKSEHTGEASDENNKIINSYYIEKENGELTKAHKLVGECDNTVIVSGYYLGENVGSNNGEGKTIEKLYEEATYEGYDFENVWGIEENLSSAYLRNVHIPESIELSMQGEGTEENPYLILNRNHLERVNDDLSACYRVGKDIDLEMKEWSPIGSRDYPFTGKFDGDGYKIKNMKIDQELGRHLGLFARIDGEVSDLIIENVDIRGEHYIGALAGYVWKENGYVHDCKIVGENRIEGKTTIGGLVGFNIGRIESCSSEGHIIGEYHLGGLVGRNNKIVRRCYSNSTVEGGKYVGGLIGYVTRNEYNPNYVEVQECYSEGKVVGDEFVGGLIGMLQARGEYIPEIKDVMSFCDIDCKSESVGGIVGKSEHIGEASDENNKIINSYYIEKENGELTKAHKLVGECDNTVIVSGYYLGENVGANNGEGKTIEKLYEEATYEGYDFENVWGIEENLSSAYLRNVHIPESIELSMQGEGTEENPYLILNRNHLERVNDDLSACYRVGKDIDLEMKEWSPIGSRDYPFTGKFDGDGYKIKNMKIDQELGRHLGLFARIDGEVRDVIIENVDIRGEHYIGALAGYVWKENGYVHDCKIVGENRIEGKTTIGGLVGFNVGRIETCSSEGHIVGEYHLGGLVGRNNKIVKRCYSNSRVEGEKYVGGLIGYVTRNEYNPEYVEVQECYSEGKVVGEEFVGGLIGILQARNKYSPEIKDVMSFCDIDSKTESVGGIVGKSEHTGEASDETNKIINSYYMEKENGELKKTYKLVGECYNTEIISGYYLGENGGTNNGKVKTIEELYEEATYEGYDFENIWGIYENESSAYLKNVNSDMFK